MTFIRPLAVGGSTNGAVTAFSTTMATLTTDGDQAFLSGEFFGRDGTKMVTGRLEQVFRYNGGGIEIAGIYDAPEPLRVGLATAFAFLDAVETSIRIGFTGEAGANLSWRFQYTVALFR